MSRRELADTVEMPAITDADLLAARPRRVSYVGEALAVDRYRSIDRDLVETTTEIEAVSA